jgi:hypothetical protein
MREWHLIRFMQTFCDGAIAPHGPRRCEDCQVIGALDLAAGNSTAINCEKLKEVAHQFKTEYFVCALLYADYEPCSTTENTGLCLCPMLFLIDPVVGKHAQLCFSNLDHLCIWSRLAVSTIVHGSLPSADSVLPEGACSGDTSGTAKECYSVLLVSLF